MQHNDLSIIIVNYNNPELIDACLRSIDKHLAGLKKEIIVVDNNSKIQNLAVHIEQYPELRVIYLSDNMGFGFANNVGVKNATGSLLFLLNSDAVFLDNTFETMLSKFRIIPPGEIWGPRLMSPDGSFQQSYSREIDFISFLTIYSECYLCVKVLKIANQHKYQNLEFVETTEVQVIYGAAMLINKLDYERMGGFAQKFFMYFEDIEFCDRFRHTFGGRVRFVPIATLIHGSQGSSRGSSIRFIFRKSRYIYGIRKFGYFAMFVVIPLDIIFWCFESILRIAISCFNILQLKRWIYFK